VSTKVFLRLTNPRGVNIAPGSAAEARYQGWMPVFNFEAEVGPSGKESQLTVSKPMDGASTKLRRMRDRNEDQPCAGLMDVVQETPRGERSVYRYTLSGVMVNDVIVQPPLKIQDASRRTIDTIEVVKFKCDRLAAPQVLMA
jgi:hypothetical protein